ncbi:MAG: hypothetical protein AAF399_01265, partial [Bacteroidota bacterium]
MKTNLLFSKLLWLLLMLLAPGIQAQTTITEEWSLPWTSNDYIHPYEVELDSSDNLYSLGWTSDYVLDSFSLIMNGTGFHLAKLTSSGSLLQSHFLLSNRGLAFYHQRPHMDVSSEGEVVIVGTFQDSLDLDAGPGTQWVYPLGTEDMVVYRMDSNFQLLWAKHIPSSGKAFAKDIEIDEQGNTYLFGNFQDSLDADPGPGTLWLTAPTGQAGIFFQKFDPAGNLLWAKAISDSVGQLDAHTLSITPNQECYLMGTYLEQVDFDPGPGVTVLDAGSYKDMFLLKLTPQGDLDWVQALPPNAQFIPTAMTSDSNGEVIFTGILYTEGIDVDPGPDSVQVMYPPIVCGYAYTPNHSTIICKWDSQGAFRWVKLSVPCEEASAPWFSGLEIGDCEEIYAIGSTEGGYSFDTTYRIATPGEQDLPPTPESHNANIAIVQLTPDGEVIWTENIGQSGDGNTEIGIDVAITSAGTLITSQERSWGYDWWLVAYSQ